MTAQTAKFTGICIPFTSMQYATERLCLSVHKTIKANQKCTLPVQGSKLEVSVIIFGLFFHL